MPAPSAKVDATFCRTAKLFDTEVQKRRNFD